MIFESLKDNIPMGKVYDQRQLVNIAAFCLWGVFDIWQLKLKSLKYITAKEKLLWMKDN